MRNVIVGIFVCVCVCVCVCARAHARMCVCVHMCAYMHACVRMSAEGCEAESTHLISRCVQVKMYCTWILTVNMNILSSSFTLLIETEQNTNLVHGNNKMVTGIVSISLVQPHRPGIVQGLRVLAE